MDHDLYLMAGEQKVQENSHLEKGRMADTWSNLTQNNHKILQGRRSSWGMFLDQLWFYFTGKYSVVLHAPVCWSRGAWGIVPYPLVFPETILIVTLSRYHFLVSILLVGSSLVAQVWGLKNVVKLIKFQTFSGSTPGFICNTFLSPQTH